MSEIIPFPGAHKDQASDIDHIIDQALARVPKQDRERLRFRLLQTIDSYDRFFTQWPLDLSGCNDEHLKKQIYDIAHEEHARKLQMLRDIIALKIQLLVDDYCNH